VLAARSVEALEQVAGEMRGLGVRAIAVPTDVSDEEQLKRLVERAMGEFGSIDVLVNNAGIEAFRRFEEIPPSDIRRTIDVNLTATLLLTRYVIPHMKLAGRGHIVNMSSVAGKQGPAFAAVYGASKAGMLAFSQSLRSEYHGTGISASAICPGFATDGGIYEELRQRTDRSVPWYVGGTTSEAVARAVVKAIKSNSADLIVNRPSLRGLFTLCSLFPRIGELILRVASRKYLERAASRHE
jgi:short-subunit dehydrogenase